MENENKILIVVDAQVDFVTGTLPNLDAQRVVPDLAQFAKNFDGLVFYTMDTHGEDYLETQEGKKLPIPHCILGTEGHALVPEVLINMNPNSVIVRKNTFGYTDWENLLYKYGFNEMPNPHIYMTGFCTDICVISNALILKATFPEVPITVYDDLCAGTAPVNHTAALKAMDSCQIEIQKINKEH